MHLHIESLSTRLAPATRGAMEDSLRTALGPFGSQISRVAVWLSDDNGPRGGIDQVCRIQVNLVPRTILLSEARASSQGQALQGAIERIIRQVRKQLALRREHDSRRASEASLPRPLTDEDEGGTLRQTGGVQ